jgi:YNFM family putative membrane transporter
LAGRLGRHRVLPFGFAIAIAGTAMTLSSSLPVSVAGLALLTIGLFASHSGASGCVGRLAAETKGHASSLYLLAYYGGSSIGGTIGGWFFSAGGWPALICFAIGALLLGLTACLRLAATSKV